MIVGFSTNFPDSTDPKKGIAAFKIRNSFGTYWGENCYIWFPHDLLTTLLVDNQIVFEGWQKALK